MSQNRYRCAQPRGWSFAHLRTNLGHFRDWSIRGQLRARDWPRWPKPRGRVLAIYGIGSETTLPRSVQSCAKITEFCPGRLSNASAIPASAGMQAEQKNEFGTFEPMFSVSRPLSSWPRCSRPLGGRHAGHQTRLQSPTSNELRAPRKWFSYNSNQVYRADDEC